MNFGHEVRVLMDSRIALVKESTLKSINIIAIKDKCDVVSVRQRTNTKL